MNTTIKNVNCSKCHGKGKNPRYKIVNGDWETGDEVLAGWDTCKDCRGQGTFKVKFVIKDEPCNAFTAADDGDERVTVRCKNGTLTNAEPYFKYSKNFFGQETRRKVEHFSAGPCMFCFGTGKHHLVAKKIRCNKCRGDGCVKEERWDPSPFGSEVKKMISSVCAECKGEKFSWEVGSDFKSTETYQSNL
jgi:DnaJ-class molecular chaperone